MAASRPNSYSRVFRVNHRLRAKTRRDVYVYAESDSGHLCCLDDRRLRSPEQLAHPALFVLSGHRRRRVGSQRTAVVVRGSLNEASKIDAAYSFAGGVQPVVQRELLVLGASAIGGGGGGKRGGVDSVRLGGWGCRTERCRRLEVCAGDFSCVLFGVPPVVDIEPGG